MLRQRAGSALRAPIGVGFDGSPACRQYFLSGAVWWVPCFGSLFRLVSFVTLLTRTFSSCFGERSLPSLGYPPPFLPSPGFDRAGGGRAVNFVLFFYFALRILFGQVSSVSGGVRTFSASLCRSHFHLSKAVEHISPCASRVHGLCFTAGGPYNLTHVRLWSRRCRSLHVSRACVLNVCSTLSC